MFNTFGVFSVNPTTFNIRYDTNYTYPKESRDQVVTALKVHNLLLNILGYIPGVNLISGAIRILTGAVMVGFTLAIGNRNAHEGLIIRHWYDEAILTGIAQMARGALEAFAPFGRMVNGALDIIGTGINVWEFTRLMGQFSLHSHDPNQPYKDPSFYGPFYVLNFV